MAEPLSTMLVASATEMGWSTEHQLIVLLSFLEHERHFDHNFDERFRSFLDSRVGEEYAEQEEAMVDCPACDGNDDDCPTCSGTGHVTQAEHDTYHSEVHNG